MADNTVVIFTSDNGGLATAEGSPTCNAPLAEGKGWMYEGGTREPLIVRWPGVVRAGAACAYAGHQHGLLSHDAGSGGAARCCRSSTWTASAFCRCCAARRTLDREAIFWHYPHYGNQGGTPGSSVRAGDCKLIEFFEDGRLELYNLANDIGEERNLAEAHRKGGGPARPCLRAGARASRPRFRGQIRTIAPD